MNNENRAEAEGRAEISSMNKLLSTFNATYDLRGNPKKSKRFSDESGNGNTLLREMMICKECGKGFQSRKALCGHMACHSEKERVFQRFEDHCDDQSDTETSTRMMRRSKRTRCKNPISSISMPIGSSSVTGIEDQHEQEEAAAKSSVEKQRETKLKSAESGPKKVKSRAGAEDVSKSKLGSKRKKGHECPFCFRIFKSGQALGGHKRSHFVGDPEDTTLLIKQDSPEMPLPPLIDLNLPAPGEEDAIYSV
ncbi:zinc finger protein ZAT1-like [Hibiscus syriacus]|uniref:zinc finger protein ZAT1-like n=1 Tax=Hibiscus syriacus TaxID=106335 RepID=UPI0019212E73|nr:zinc finger protein ZAT1-like [Hibiscus syriacus]